MAISVGCSLCTRMLKRDGSMSDITIQQAMSVETDLTGLFAVNTEKEIDEFLKLAGWENYKSFWYRMSTKIFGKSIYLNPGVRMLCPHCQRVRKGLV